MINYYQLGVAPPGAQVEKFRKQASGKEPTMKSVITILHVILIITVTESLAGQPPGMASGMGSGNINKIIDEEGSGGSGADYSATPSGTAAPSPSPSPSPSLPPGSYVLKIKFTFNNGSAIIDDFVMYIESLLDLDDDNTNSTLVVQTTESGWLMYYEDLNGNADNHFTERIIKFLQSNLSDIEEMFPDFVSFEMIYIEIIPTSSPVPSSTVMSPTGTPANPSDTAIIIVWGVVPPVIFVVIITACVIMVIVAAGLIKKKRRKRDKRNRHRYLEDDTPMIHLPKPNFASKVSVISKGHRLENFTKPMFVRDISECLAFPAKLHAEYMSIPPNMTSMDEIPPGAQDKNRYTDVLPNPNSRVVLFLKFGKANSDYINANYIRGFRGLPKSFIATQGPLAYTIADFWRMVWEQKATVIIMLTDLIEKNKVKCEQYWPTSQGNTEIYQEIQVFTRKIENCGKYILTTLIVHHLERNVKREVYHYWYKEWPNVGVPENAQSMVDFLLETRRTREYFSMPGPTIVHCSAGIGRTGVFIAADIGMRELEEMRSVDVVRIVASLRQDRGGMVQTKDQYIFLHKVFFEYAKRMGHVMPVVRGVNDEDSDSCSSHSSIQLNTFLY